MTINLRLFGALQPYYPPEHAGRRSARLCLSPGVSVRQLILQLGIPYGEDEGQIVAAVNGREVDHDTALREGDTVSLFEPLAGG